MKKLINLLGIALLISLFWACEDTIYPQLENAPEVVVIDAWINNLNQVQKIKITKTQPYFLNTLPPGVRGAKVLVSDNEGQLFEFTEGNAAGEYLYDPTTAGQVFGKVGKTYTLLVQWNGREFRAQSTMGRVPQIDSVSFYFEKGRFGFPDSHFAEFWARDFEGSGDTYWAKGWKNGQLLNKPNEIVTAYDAGFSRGSNVDGIIFIAPIRRGFNPTEQDANNNFLPVYQNGDSLYVELHSVSEKAFDFLQQVRIQTDRPGGFAELFAQPLANVLSNIEVLQAPEGERVVGIFNVSSVSANGARLRIEN
jgi:hypothetical protein